MNEHLIYKGIYQRLYRWYEQNHRVLPWRETADPYCIWISEIILQQTRVNQGFAYYMRFIERFPDVQTLAVAEEDEILRYWQGLGYYSRARNLHKAAQWVMENGQFVGGKTGKELLENHTDSAIPKEKADAVFRHLRTMAGVGDYTAGAIASFAYNLPYPALDGNVYRVLARLYDCDMAFDSTAGKKYFHHLAKELLDNQNPRLFNSAIMEFGALYCTPTAPDCEQCPVQEWCMGYAHHTVELLPVRKPRPTLRDRYLNYTIYLTEDGRTLLHQRTGNDIWKHLYEFPLIETEHLSDIGNQKQSIDMVHVLSHQRLHARFHIEKVSELPPIPETITVRISDLDDYALSKLTLNALERLL